MSDNVFTLTPKIIVESELVYVCPCDSEQYTLYCSGFVHCAECGREISNLVIRDHTAEDF